MAVGRAPLEWLVLSESATSSSGSRSSRVSSTLPSAEVRRTGAVRSSALGVGGRQGGALLSAVRGRLVSGMPGREWSVVLSGVEGVGDGDVDGLGVDRADEFVEAVQPGEQIGLAAQDG